MDDSTLSRRRFLEFLGRGALLGPTVGILSAESLFNVALALDPKNLRLPFRPLDRSDKDAVLLAEGFHSQILIKEGAALNSRYTYGANNDFTAFLPLGSNEGLLFVNHEEPRAQGIAALEKKETLAQRVTREQKEVGASLLQIKKEKGKWKTVASSLTRRWDGQTKIPFSSGRTVAGATEAIGTLGNCSGGTTPWGTLLTCEENFQNFYKADKSAENGWDKILPYPPEHYGWVVEINPKTGEAKKLVALGRFCHEGALAIKTPSNKTVVYMGDDANDQFLYKFISDSPDQLESGQLFVANLPQGKWIPLDYKNNSKLKEAFKSETEMLIETRKAATLLGATPLARPEGIAQDPLTKAVYVALTNQKDKKNFHGEILKLEENKGDMTSLEFKSSTFMAGGTLFSCPDNLAFDPKGNLWMTSDISGKESNKPPYEIFKNNGLFYIPLHGDLAGNVFQVASAPRDAEFTGPSFTPDGRTLFLSVQHPGETSKTAFTSHWPNGGKSAPRSSLIAISGESLDKLMS